MLISLILCPSMSKLDDLAPLNSDGALLVLTGAGISVESGIPSYRGPDVSEEQTETYMRTMSRGSLISDPSAVWRRIDEMRGLVHAAEPNDAHHILARWEQEERFDSMLVATQNIDGLHQRAGSQRVSELHGSLWQLARPRAVPFAEDPQFSEDVELMGVPELRDEILQRWAEQNEHEVWEDRRVPFASIPPSEDPSVRPNVVLFDEPYGSRLVWVEDSIKRQQPDTVLVIGCSGGVTILDYLLRQCRSANPACRIININPHLDAVEVPHEYLAVGASGGLGMLDAMTGKRNDL